MTSSSPTRRFARAIALGTLLAATLAAAGCDDDDYDPPAGPRPSLVARGELEFDCGSTSCSYEGEAINEGMGCAVNVRGVTRLLAANGSELERDSWLISPLQRIRPGEPFLYEGCCVSLADRNLFASYRTEIEWDRITCDG